MFVLQQSATAGGVASRQRVYRVGDFVALTKPRVMSLVLFTAFVGFAVAPGNRDALTGGIALLCIAMGAGGAGALNMWYEAELDATMPRTARRPIPNDRVSGTEALAFGLALVTAGVAGLLMVNALAAALLALTVFFYVVVYTMWLKRRTPQNIVIGGAAGALPPVIGWVAATGHIAIEPLLLFLIILLWTPPHFWALSLNRAGEYARAGIPMLPVVAGKEATKRQILVYTVMLVAAALLPWALGFAGALYAAVAGCCGAVLLFLAIRLLTSQRGSEAAFARRLFGFSIIYLFLLFAGLLADPLVYGDSVTKMDHENFFTQRLNELRGEGRYRVFADLERRCDRFPRAYHHRIGEDVTVWWSNDCLGMGQHPIAIDAMIEAVRSLDASTRNVSDNTYLHDQLDAELADLHPHEAALVFTPGYVADEAVLPTLAQTIPGVVVASDALNHASMIAGIRNGRTAVLSPAEIAAPIRQLEAKQRNLSVLLAEVTGVDLVSRTIEASSPGAGVRKVAYDRLVVATGMRPSYFGQDEFARYAPGLKSLSDAETIRAKILGAFELAATTEDEGERVRQTTFVLVGAGPTGVELAASLAQMVKVTLRGNFRRIDPAKANIILLDGAPRVLPTFAEPLSRKVARRLERLGVKVLTGVKVETVDEQGVTAGGSRIPSAPAHQGGIGHNLPQEAPRAFARAVVDVDQL